MAEKTVNYTPEQTVEMLAAYTAAPTAETVTALAEKLGKTTRSIIAKLSREGVYKKKEYTTKKGEKPVKKDNLANQLGAICGLSEAEVDSLEKANKTALVKILGFMSNLAEFSTSCVSEAAKVMLEAENMERDTAFDSESREG